ncbi:MAG: DUF5050 domain-containing protein [Clostridium sp.]|nr:DUF5050 domain-containing protein [Clostridium sp.]
MKKIISIVIVAITTLSLVSCSDKSTTSSEKEEPTSINMQASSSSVEAFAPLVLNDDNLEPSSFIMNGTSLLFTNWQNNNRISILNEPFPKGTIKENDVADFFNYSATSIASSNNLIYFGDQSSSSNLASINIADKSYTKLNNRHAHDVTVLNNESIFYLDIPDTDTSSRKLYKYDINSKKDLRLTSDNVGKYIVNNNFILYQNLSDNSKLYRVSIDGTGKEKVTDYSVNSFAGYSSQLLTINSDDNNNLYIVDPTTLDSKKYTTLSITDLKVSNGSIYVLDSSNKLCNLEITINPATTIDQNEYKLTPLSSDSINEYYPTQSGIFVQKGIDVNNPYFISANK